ncbi:DUF1613-domain-containing protein [Tilletiaria anomala UBC 951]|uniref:tRNA (uracil-O(2)-)-methyltransferase n=1 Tax=Tilletiaria anomala (strain ATCC 24038 / CBS 436.72 / UBC 951) TaxID=1037660 RepID=A0A066W0U5_TILAU|nr:DUF1613-domain-containing protein [Tilletiaria anomala UBC 951]KDN44390.1 DUF1613-domain-containing protein [Tilletiaria anomala UBC 951]
MIAAALRTAARPVASRAVVTATPRVAIALRAAAPVPFASIFRRTYASGGGLSTADIQSRIVEVLKSFEKVDPAKVTATSSFTNDLGLDSLDAVEVVMAIEEEFSIEIPDEEADNIATVQQAIDYIAKSPEAEDMVVRPKCHVRFLPRNADSCSNLVASEGAAQQVGSSRCTERAEVIEATPKTWIPLAECDAHFPLRAWWITMLELARHPERNSTYILRADIVSEDDAGTSRLRAEVGADHERDEQEAELCSGEPLIPVYQWQKTIIRRLLPRNPNIDRHLDQSCTFLRRRRCQLRGAHNEGSADPIADGTKDPPLEDGLVIYTPLVDSQETDPEAQIPFYHPKVKALAYHYIADHKRADAAKYGTLRLEVQLFPQTSATLSSPLDSPALPLDHRLMRTAKSLLETQHKHSFGSANSYQKRVHHDVVVPRDAFQDTYVRLKVKYAFELTQGWQERTDPQKHVFEDLGIAAFLIELWRDTYEQHGGVPPGGFVDIGCGNGLLVHILRREGFPGYGIDLRARKSWPAYETRGGGKDLRLVSLYAPGIVASDDGKCNPGEFLAFPQDSFLIGNHADELTPYLPLLATVTPGENVGFINIPCCPWQLDGTRFGRTKFEVTEEQIASLLPAPFASSAQRAQILQKTLHNIRLGPVQPHMSLPHLAAQSSTRNSAYLNYIGLLQLQAGWHVEKEALRIPSTKNWCLIGRRRVWQQTPTTFGAATMNGVASAKAKQQGTSTHVERAVRELQHEVRERVRQLAMDAAPGWKARTPEGNAGHAAQEQE